MELKPGYKQTEVGVIPEDWDVPCLGDYSEITKLAGFEYTNYFNSYKDSGQIIVIRGTNITFNSLDLSDVRTIPKSTSDKLPRSKLKKNDLVFAYVGTIGPVFLIDKDYRYHLGPNTARITCKDGLNPRFVFCYFRSDLIRKEITERISTGAQPSLSMAKIRAFRVLRPTKAEQEAIVGALSDADAHIESLEQLISKKRLLKQGTMQELLTGKKRLPGFSEAWERKRLGELSEMGSGGTPLSTNTAFYGGDIPWVSISDMTKCGKYISATDKNLTAEGMDSSSAQMFPARTVLYAMYASLGECSIAGVPVCSSQAILGIRTKSSLDNEFLYYFLTSIFFQVKAWGQQGTQANLNKGMVQDFQLMLPPLKEQIAIASVFSDMDAEITALETKLAKARQVKQGMMQELLTGRIRLI